MSVQSIERAFTLLRALAVGPSGVTDLAAKAHLPKSTVARLLGALEHEGAVTQDRVGGDYRLGEGLIDIAGAAQPGRNLVSTARPHLLELTDHAAATLKPLFAAYVERPDEMRPWYGRWAGKVGLHRAVCDYLAGMTDRFAEQEHARLVG